MIGRVIEAVQSHQAPSQPRKGGVQSAKKMGAAPITKTIFSAMSNFNAPQNGSLVSVRWIKFIADPRKSGALFFFPSW